VWRGPAEIGCGVAEGKTVAVAKKRSGGSKKPLSPGETGADVGRLVGSASALEIIGSLSLVSEN